MNKRLILFVVLALAIYLVWQYWPFLFVKAMSTQRFLHHSVSDYLYRIVAEPSKVWLVFGMSSFLYGLIHSIGIGHGKTLIASYLLSHAVSVKQALMITVSTALLQATSACVFIELSIRVFGFSIREMTNSLDVFIQVNYAGVVIVGIMIIIKSCLSSRSERASNQSWLGLVMTIGIRPCTGAIMLLVLSNALNVKMVGVVSAYLMALGTAVTTSLLALLSIYGRNNLLLSKSPVRSKSSISVSRAVGGGLISLIGCYFMLNPPILPRFII